MAKRLLICILLFVLFVLNAVFSLHAAARPTGRLVVYWGQDAREGSLASTCNNGTYDIVVLSFIAVFGNGMPPTLNLQNHCAPEFNTCISLTNDIHSCQSQGIEVLVSLGGGAGAYGLASSRDAREVAQYLWDNFLGGNVTAGSVRPLGPAVLDGVDFDIEASQNPYWPTLAGTLKNFSAGVKLSTAPQCPFPDAYMGPGPGTALQTGLFDYVWVQFYNNPPCDYAGNNDVKDILDAWDQWSSSIPGSPGIFLGLPAAPDAAPAGGYLPASVLVTTVLPQIKKRPTYAGVMLWSRYFDSISGFGASTKHHL